MLIADKTAVQIHYTLTDDAGNVIDTSRDEGGQPLAYLHGMGNIVVGLEKALTGLKKGDQKKVVVTPAEGYGEHDPRGVQKVPRTQFPTDVEIEPENGAAQEYVEDCPVCCRPNLVRAWIAVDGAVRVEVQAE